MLSFIIAVCVMAAWLIGRHVEEPVLSWCLAFGIAMVVSVLVVSRP